jgi:hypothetical protein
LKQFAVDWSDVHPEYLEVSVKGKKVPPMLKQRKPKIWSMHHSKKYREIPYESRLESSTIL